MQAGTLIRAPLLGLAGLFLLTLTALGGCVALDWAVYGLITLDRSRYDESDVSGLFVLSSVPPFLSSEPTAPRSLFFRRVEYQPEESGAPSLVLEQYPADIEAWAAQPGLRDDDFGKRLVEALALEPMPTVQWGIVGSEPSPRVFRADLTCPGRLIRAYVTWAEKPPPEDVMPKLGAIAVALDRDCALGAERPTN